ncbi:MAG TPA: NBR1-Ig-like domain-containing protein [Anaerolineales bacterium]|jgi:hypothetical protein|nr:NBR1-Ig-like domain-containing protein [Anaerolineales bacterium]
MKQFRLIKILVLLIIGVSALSLAGCNLPSRATTTPTLNVTQAYQTVEARLTEAISRTPSISPTRPIVTSTPGQPSPSPTQEVQTVTPENTQPSSSCDQALPGVPIDVTIPDDTILRPGEIFTKTWRLQNAGNCTWNSNYALVWFSGEQLDATSNVPLNGSTAAGQSVDLSVEMKAPETPGTYQGWWKLRNPSGAMFGIGPNSDAGFWVRIIVEGTPISSGTPTVTETSGPTLTPTVGVQVSGPATLLFGDLYDLDRNEINDGGEDLTYEEVGLTHNLIPFDNTVMAVSGPNQPSLTTCQGLNLSADPISVDNLTGNFICYRTNMSLPGWLYINTLDPENGNLNVEIYTWLIP